MARLGAIRFLTIHCAATPEGRAVPAAEISRWDIAKFGQVSYHWVVELSGIPVRTLADDVLGAHVGKANTGNIGVCYIGGVDALHGSPKDTRTSKQKQSLRTLVRTYQDRVPGLIVRGHNEWPGVMKACPSFDVSDWLAAGMPI